MLGTEGDKSRAGTYGARKGTSGLRPVRFHRAPIRTEGCLVRDSLPSVGVTGFEPATTCTPCKCATGLRYTPKRGANVSEQDRKRASLFQMKDGCPDIDTVPLVPYLRAGPCRRLYFRPLSQTDHATIHLPTDRCVRAFVLRLRSGG